MKIFYQSLPPSLRHTLHLSLLVGLAAAMVLLWSSIGKSASAVIDIEATQNTPACLTFVGHGTTETGNIYILGTDGERYDLLVTNEIVNALPLVVPILEATYADIVETKFCLPDGAVEIDINNGKFVNIIIRNL